jgi:hypothetical protein
MNEKQTGRAPFLHAIKTWPAEQLRNLRDFRLPPRCKDLRSSAMLRNTHCPQSPVTNYQYMLRNIAEGQSYQLRNFPKSCKTKSNLEDTEDGVGASIETR